MSDPSAPAAGQQAAQGTIRMTIQGSELTTNIVPPTVHVNGHQLVSRFGVMDVPVWAGRNRVEVYSQWMRRYGQATLDIDVAPGQVVPVFYAMPWHQFTTGSIGFEKQKRRGAGALFGIIGGLVGLILLVVLLAALA
ncbi:MAG: hypothetical protein ACRCXL_01610 [Dermatophilaceae bacterium]